MSHRLTRKDMKRDEVMEGLSRVAHFIAENARALGMGLVAVLALIAGFVIWQAVAASREGKANDDLSAALQGAGESESGLGEAREGLTDVVSSHGGTRAGAIAYAYLGTIAAREGDYATAREHWQEFLDRHDEHALAANVERNLISLDRAEGREEELAQRLRSALETGSSALGEATVLYELGRTLEQLGQTEDAVDIYARLVEEYPTSLFAGRARERTTVLETS